MRQLSITVLLVFAFIISGVYPVFSAVTGKIEYNIPIDYSNLSEQDLNIKARHYFYNALQAKDGETTEYITQALILYSILQNMNPEHTEYSVRLGILYDKINKDRYAKGNFARAIQVNHTNPKPYFYYAEYYYKRQSYRKALKYYKEAYKYGYEKNYDTLYKMGDIYEKFGDTRSALKYLKEAEKQSPNNDLELKIKRIESNDAINKEYYSDTRIRG
ncbi:MAG: tetratricopeptide repeat protein [Cyanobacteria bacterium SIG31]|nr:tetratricopeptide repeat protein [Cyanobacteria bacterium SIG31]